MHGLATLQRLNNAAAAVKEGATFKKIAPGRFLLSQGYRVIINDKPEDQGVQNLLEVHYDGERVVNGQTHQYFAVCSRDHGITTRMSRNRLIEVAGQFLPTVNVDQLLNKYFGK